ncbi:hypothetical protein [Kineosporia sp. NBRC 101731]|uniref:hypothetical protein n=1 Tax=Kineosporia sp. NBRC 101731 TaxID=3032199 RepID=UPI0024A47336|nr:hypothetical protein [Kineosporia sp. NBRC 101731]GLY33568.1 acyl-CoA dehydrogenase [Kineosporia sp. NBRC 101731]
MTSSELKILAEHAAETEAQGRPVAESVEAVRADLTLSRGAGAVTTVRRLAELASACPSTSWNVGTNAVTKTLAKKAFGDALPDGFDQVQACGTGVPSGRAERGADGVRVTGSWKSVSGCEDATWAGVGVLDADVFSIALVPTAELKVLHTWDMAGMRGTGSHTLVADGVLVPEELIAPMPLPGPLSDRLYFGLTVLAPVVGATRGALSVIEDLFASDRKPYMTAYTRMGESSGARYWLAEATRLTNRAEQAMLAVAALVDSEDIPETDGPRLVRELAEASRDCRAAVELMLDLGGTRGFAKSSTLQRFWRDIAVAGRHPILNTYLAAERSEAVLAPA